MLLLSALPYHQKVKDYFKAQTKTWDYFSVAKNKEEQLKEFKADLLKNTYKFDADADKALYEKINFAKECLGLKDLPVTVYQAQYTDELNASIVFLHNEAHIVLCGPLTKLMDDEELLAILAHELSHVKLYSMMESELEVADRIITAIANNYNSEPCYYETARLFRLYTEIFCDRGAYAVLKKINPVISSLVKSSTGLDVVHAESYLKQADEILSVEESFRTTRISHPENFIRAKALQLWHEKGEQAEAEIVKMIEGVTDIDHLDIFQQKYIAELTLQIIQLFLKPKWIQTTMIISLARQYFPHYKNDEKALLSEKLIEKISKSHASVKEYLAYVLMDFSLADSALELVPMGWAFQFSEDIYIKGNFEAIVKKEKKLSDKKLLQQKQQALSAYYGVKENESEQIYEE